MKNKIKFIPQLVFETLCTSPGIPDHPHLLQNQFITSIDIKLHAKKQLYNSNSFCDGKAKNSCNLLAKSIFAFNHAHLKLHDKFAPLIDMKFHPQNQLYTSISFLS